MLISLFDGIGGARRAFELLGLGLAGYCSAETHGPASRVARYAWPDIWEIGDVCALDEAGSKS